MILCTYNHTHTHTHTHTLTHSLTQTTEACESAYLRASVNEWKREKDIIREILGAGPTIDLTDEVGMVWYGMVWYCFVIK